MSYKQGDRVSAKVGDWEYYYDGYVKRLNDDGTYYIRFDDGEKRKRVMEKEIKGLLATTFSNFTNDPTDDNNNNNNTNDNNNTANDILYQEPPDIEIYTNNQAENTNNNIEMTTPNNETTIIPTKDKEKEEDDGGGVKLGKHWIKYLSEHGDEYYFNTETHVSQWEYPEELIIQDQKKPPPPTTPKPAKKKVKQQTGAQEDDESRLLKTPINRVPLLNYNDDDDEMNNNNEERDNNLKNQITIERTKDVNLLKALNIACKNIKNEVSLNAGLLLEQQLYLKAKVFGTGAPSIIKSAKYLCKLYNKLGMKQVAKNNFDLAIQLFNKAKELTLSSPHDLNNDESDESVNNDNNNKNIILAKEDGKSYLYFNDTSLLSLRLLTMNNVACALRREGDLDQSLRILTDAIDYGSNKIVGAAEHLNICHLNRCAVLSQLHQHERAIQDAQFSIYYGQEAVANVGSSPKALSDRVVSLAAGYYNLAVQLEHCVSIYYFIIHHSNAHVYI